MLDQFELRSRILKARSAHALLNDVLHSGGCDDRPLLGALEELSSGTNEFEEVQLLLAVRSGQVELKPDQLAELDRLLGGSGHDTPSRLGLPAGTDRPEVCETALCPCGRQQVAEHPPSRPYTAQMAARVAMRTLEGIVTQAARAAEAEASTSMPEPKSLRFAPPRHALAAFSSVGIRPRYPPRRPCDGRT